MLQEFSKYPLPSRPGTYILAYLVDIVGCVVLRLRGSVWVEEHTGKVYTNEDIVSWVEIYK